MCSVAVVTLHVTPISIQEMCFYTLPVIFRETHIAIDGELYLLR